VTAAAVSVDCCGFGFGGNGGLVGSGSAEKAKRELVGTDDVVVAVGTNGGGIVITDLNDAVGSGFEGGSESIRVRAVLLVEAIAGGGGNG
jgi:hypothetical protein